MLCRDEQLQTADIVDCTLGNNIRSLSYIREACATTYAINNTDSPSRIKPSHVKRKSTELGLSNATVLLVDEGLVSLGRLSIWSDRAFAMRIDCQRNSLKPSDRFESDHN